MAVSMNGTSAAAVGTYIYIFGGYNGSVNDFIQKFDTVSSNITVSSLRLPNACSNTSAAAVGNNIYIFGGYGSAYYNTIVKYTEW